MSCAAPRASPSPRRGSVAARRDRRDPGCRSGRPRCRRSTTAIAGGGTTTAPAHAKGAVRRPGPPGEWRPAASLIGRIVEQHPEQPFGQRRHGRVGEEQGGGNLGAQRRLQPAAQVHRGQRIHAQRDEFGSGSISTTGVRKASPSSATMRSVMRSNRCSGGSLRSQSAVRASTGRGSAASPGRGSAGPGRPARMLLPARGCSVRERCRPGTNRCGVGTDRWVGRPAVRSSASAGEIQPVPGYVRGREGLGQTTGGIGIAAQ